MTSSSHRSRIVAGFAAWLAVAAAGCADEPPADNLAPSTLAMTEQAHEPLFPLEQGAHAAASCASCHADEASFRPTCTNCHDHGRTISDAQHTRVTGYRFADAACLECHPRGAIEGPGFDHDPFFPISAGAVHANVACATCHTVPGDRTQFSCVGCHEHDEATMAPVHAALADYAWDSARCYGCHPDSSIPDAPAPPEHEVIFPLRPPSAHSAVACDDCHLSRTDRTDVMCIPCHEEAATAAEHGGVQSYVYETPACRDCHPRGK